MSKKRVIKAGAGYVIGNYMLKGISFITIPIFSRLMSTSDYGLFNTFVAYESILYIIIGLALHSSFKNAKYKFIGLDLKESRYNQYVSTVIFLILINILVFLCIGVFFNKIIFDLFAIDSLSLYLLIIYSGGTAILACFNSYISLEYKYDSFLKISFANAISNILVSLILMFTFFDSNRYVARIIGTTFPVIFVCFYICILFFYKERPLIFNKDLKWGIKYSLPIIPHGISQVVLSQFDRIMITNMINSSTSGIYSFAYNIYSILAVTSSSLDNVWNPWIYEKLHKHEYQCIKKHSTIYAAFMLVISIVVILISPELVLLLGGNKYQDAVYCVIPIVASGYFSFLYTIPASIEYFNEKTNYIAIGTTFAAVVNIILNYIFISKYGYIAAAYTTLITYALYFIVHYFIAIKVQGKCLFETQNFLFMIILLIVFSVLSYIFLNYLFIRLILVSLLIIVCIVYFYKNLNLKYIIIKYIKKRSV